MVGQRSHSLPSGSMIIVQLVSGKPGASAMTKGLVHLPVAFTLRAPRINTSSLLRSPEPWNQQTSISPLGHSTRAEPWLCHDSSGKMSSPSTNGSAPYAVEPKANKIINDEIEENLNIIGPFGVFVDLAIVIN